MISRVFRGLFSHRSFTVGLRPTAVPARRQTLHKFPNDLSNQRHPSSCADGRASTALNGAWRIYSDPESPSLRVTLSPFRAFSRVSRAKSPIHRLASGSARQPCPHGSKRGIDSRTISTHNVKDRDRRVSKWFRRIHHDLP